MDASISAIGQIALTVTDLPRAVGFYRDALGLQYLFEASGMAFFNCGGVRLMLTGAEKQTANSILYYKAADIQALADTLTSKGVTCEAPPRLIAKMPDHDLWMAFFRDSEGNLLALMSEVR